MGSLHAGTETTATDYKSAKDKNVIQPPAPKPPRFYLSIGGGGDVDYTATKFLSNGGGTLGGEPARFDARTYPKVHDLTARGEFTAGYNLNQVVSFFGRFEYEHAYTSRENIGSVEDTAGLFGTNRTRNYDVSADLRDYQSYTGKGGVRVNIPIKQIPFVKPYFTAAVGGKYLDGTSADVQIDGDSSFNNPVSDVGRVALYRSGWVISSDARLGLELALTRHLAFDLEGGIGYDGKPERAHTSSHNNNGNGFNATTPESLGLTGVNDGGDRLYSPLTAAVKVSF